MKLIIFLLPLCESVVTSYKNNLLAGFFCLLWRPVSLFLCEDSWSDFPWKRAPEPLVLSIDSASHSDDTAANDLSTNTKKRKSHKSSQSLEHVFKLLKARVGIKTFPKCGKGCWLQHRPGKTSRGVFACLRSEILTNTVSGTKYELCVFLIAALFNYNRKNS